MRKLVLGCVILGTLAITNAPVVAQFFQVQPLNPFLQYQDGPYYADPSWDQQIPPFNRFIILTNWNNQAVLDRETGLVWQRNPDGPTNTWWNAQKFCHTNSFGNRYGWRMPSVEELSSLLDPGSGIGLPAGHPFGEVQNDYYWTATLDEIDFTSVYAVGFGANPPLDRITFLSKTGFKFSWCVRGGSIAAGQNQAQTPPP